MGKIVDAVIAISIICIGIGIICRLYYNMNILIVGSRGYIGFAGVLLLLAIALMLRHQLGSK